MKGLIIRSPLKIKTEPFVISEAAVYNGVKLKTIFDTGFSSAFSISKKMADSIGVKEIDREPLSAVNGVEMRVNYGIIDSVKIGDILLINYPVAIFYDGFVPHSVSDSILEARGKKEKAEEILNSFDVIMGTPALSLFASFDIDFENEVVTFSSKDIESDLSKESNMFILGGITYIRTLMNDIPFTAVLDLGDIRSGITIKKPFHEKNKKAFPFKENSESTEKGYLSLSGHHMYSNVNRPSILDVTILDQTTDATDETMMVDEESQKQEDGIIGLPLLKKFKKVSFDFQNMIFKAE